jgi:ADP-heptose:LPS heptosyltransferase
MGSLLREMDLVVSVDSGPQHVAAAVGVPVLAVFGATDPRRTGPYGEQHRVVQAKGAGDRADLARAYRERDSVGAWDVPSETVTQAALDML